MTTIKITTTEAVTTLHSPYSPTLPAMAKAIGGKFDGGSKSWVFAKQDEERVRDLARQLYGTDGTQSDLVNVRCTLAEVSSSDLHIDYSRGSTWYFSGRVLVSRAERDAAVRLGPDVILVAGQFASSSGSRANPTVGAVAGIILEIRNIPRNAVEGKAGFEIIETHVDLDALRSERDRLASRIAEIDALLAN